MAGFLLSLLSYACPWAGFSSLFSFSSYLSIPNREVSAPALSYTLLESHNHVHMNFSLSRLFLPILPLLVRPPTLFDQCFLWSLKYHFRTRFRGPHLSGSQRRSQRTGLGFLLYRLSARGLDRKQNFLDPPGTPPCHFELRQPRGGQKSDHLNFCSSPIICPSRPRLSPVAARRPSGPFSAPELRFSALLYAHLLIACIFA